MTDFLPRLVAMVLPTETVLLPPATLQAVGEILQRYLVWVAYIGVNGMLRLEWTC
jgi:hypothetical protein